MSQELHLELLTASNSLHQLTDTSKVVGRSTTDALRMNGQQLNQQSLRLSVSSKGQDPETVLCLP